MGLIWIPLVVLGVLLFPFCIGPLLVHLSFRLSTSPSFDTVGPDSEELPGPVREHFERVADEMETCGFAPAALLSQSDPGQGVLSLLMFLENREAGVSAAAAAAYNTVGRTRELHNGYLEFITEFDDGSEIDTSNSPDLENYTPGGRRLVRQFPGVVEAGRLFEIHRRLEGRVSGKTRRLRPAGTTPADHLRENELKILSFQVEEGFLFLDQAVGAYRPTWKGACLMTWGQIWPVSAVRRARMRREARETLRELNFTS